MAERVVGGALRCFDLERFLEEFLVVFGGGFAPFLGQVKGLLRRPPEEASSIRGHAALWERGLRPFSWTSHGAASSTSGRGLLY